ncbi:hypothetical protein U3516DRAFT_805682 [Neocallimastix sp. 'constans']
MIEDILHRKSPKYDIIIYDNIYTKKFESYFLDLSEHLPQEHLDVYSKSVLSQSCIHNNKWISLPISSVYTILYSNMKYLNKYNKDVPKTWDELIETSKYIVNEEKKINNTNLLGYNGGLNGTCSIYEFIHSCRESYESPFPNLLDNTTINALNLLKRIKNEASSVIFSSIPSLYYDEEVCSVIDCDYYRSFQPVERPIWKTGIFEWDNYSLKFRNHIYEFLYGNKTAAEALQNVIDILKIYNISIHTHDNYVGIIIFILLSIILILIIFSMFIPLFKVFEFYFKIFSYDFWIIYLSGSIVLLYLCFMEYGEISQFKCKLKTAILFFGNYLNQFPFFYELLIYFPLEFKGSKFINDHRLLIIFIYSLINIILIILSFFVPIYSKEIIIDNGKNFKSCRIKDLSGNILNSFLYFMNNINMLLMLYIIFMEWNIQETFIEIKLLSSSVYMNVLLYILLLIFSFIDINNYIFHFVIYENFYILFIISNYVCLFGSRIILAINKKNKNNEKEKNEDRFFIAGNNNKLNHLSSLSNTNSIIQCTNNTIYQYILKYHEKQIESGISNSISETTTTKNTNSIISSF